MGDPSLACVDAVTTIVGIEDNDCVVCDSLFLQVVHDVTQAFVYSFAHRCVLSLPVVHAAVTVFLVETFVRLDRSVSPIVGHIKVERLLVGYRIIQGFKGLPG